jgi:hypothetical protein
METHSPSTSCSKLKFYPNLKLTQRALHCCAPLTKSAIFSSDFQKYSSRLNRLMVKMSVMNRKRMEKFYTVTVASLESDLSSLISTNTLTCFEINEVWRPIEVFCRFTNEQR